MSLAHTVVLNRRMLCSEFTVQSLVGVSFPDGRSWLLSPADSNVSLPYMQYQLGAEEKAGVTYQSWATHIGNFLEIVFPQEEHFEIFRMHYNTIFFLIEHERPKIYGKPFGQWRSWNSEIRQPVEYALSFEHLWGSFEGERGETAFKLQTDRADELIHRCPVRVTKTRQELDQYCRFLPHPGILPPFDDEREQYIAFAEMSLRQAATPAVERIN